jgi:DnaJ-class molecular chaperone
MADEERPREDAAEAAPAVGSPCAACKGTGVAASGRYHCWQCYGTGKVQEKKYYWNLDDPADETAG